MNLRQKCKKLKKENEQLRNMTVPTRKLFMCQSRNERDIVTLKVKQTFDVYRKSINYDEISEYVLDHMIKLLALELGKYVNIENETLHNNFNDVLLVTASIDILTKKKE